MKRLLRFAPMGAILAGATLHAQTGAGVPIAQEFERLHFRSIGPSVMSGRISELAVYEKDPAIFYAATAHGGLWKTTSNAADFKPLFQDVGLMSIGSVAVSQSNPNLVWIGGGEVNNRQTTSFGDGVYKSTDGGTTWQKMGLERSHHVARIVIDPANDDIVLVASNGSLFGPGGDRGIFKTTDGGRTWRNVLQTDSLTGATELVAAPSNPRIMYAATYQRRRHALGMNSTGPGSAVWKSTDAGETWTKLGGGLPTGSLGRIGLGVYRHNPNLIYALVEVGGGRGGRIGSTPESDDDSLQAAIAGRGGRGGGRAGAGGPGGGGGTGFYRTDDGGATWRFMSATNPRPNYYSQIRIDPNDPDRVYLGGVGLHITENGGRTFEVDAALVTHDDIHAIWVNPANANHIIIGSDGGISSSYDRGKNWKFVPNLVAGLFYHVSYDMEVPYNICGGMQDNYNWCGPSQSRMGRGIMAHEWFQILGGDGFHAIPDLRDSRIIYTESQNGNMIRRNKVTGESKNIRPTPDNVINARPGDAPYRFNWDSPMMISPVDPGVLYVAADRVFRSTDRGDSWTMISPVLTKGSSLYSIAESPKQAGVLYAGSDDGSLHVTRDGGRTWTDIEKNLPGMFPGGVIAEVVPSRFDVATVYVVVDGHFENKFEPFIWVSNDYGTTFRSINGNLRATNTRTLTEDTRNPDVLYLGTESGIFLTIDRGRSWKRLKANLPYVRIDELTIHPRENALLVATHGRSLFVLDHLEPIQEYAAAMASTTDAKLFSVPNALQWKTKDDRNDEFWGHQFFMGENPPNEAVIQLHLKRRVNDLKLRITDASGATVRELPVPANRNQPGIQTVCWDQRVEPIAPAGGGGAAPPAAGRGGGGGGGGGAGGAGGRAGGGGGPVAGYPVPLPPVGYLPENPCGGGGGGRGGGGGGAGPHVMPGTYNVALIAGTQVLETKPMRIVMDPEVQFTDAARRRWYDIAMDLHALQRRGSATAASLTALYPQMTDIAGQLARVPAVPAAVKSQFDALNRDFDAVRVKFGVGPAPGADSAAQAPGGGGRGGGRGGGGGGRGGGGAAANDADVLAAAGAAKSAIIAIWEAPSEVMVRRYTDSKTALTAAIAEANGFLTRASAMSTTLARHAITLNVVR